MATNQIVCVVCGFENQQSWSFCGQCGRALDDQHFVDQGLPMDTLGKKEAKLLSSNLAPGEKVLCRAVGALGHSLVITDRRVLVLGSVFGPLGDKVRSYSLSAVSFITCQAGLVYSSLNMTVAGVLKTTWRDGRISVYPTPVRFLIRNAQKGKLERAAALVMELRCKPTPAASSVPSADILTQIAALARLRESGVLTPEELASKKAELLARM